MSQPLSSSGLTSWAKARSWLLNDALPLWSDRGFDGTRNVFHERLTLEGLPVTQVPRRVMVQARQIYCYATAARHGWIKGSDDLVRKAAESMVRDYFEADGNPGWVMSVDSRGEVADVTRDFYGHSFVIFALAAAFQTTGDDHYLDLADKTLVFLDSMMSSPKGGYVSRLPLSPHGELLQNPHMHLFEAILALYAVAPKEDYKARLEALYLLMEERFFQPVKGILCEYFSPDWVPVPGDRGQLFEPGHHYEWTWLLTYSSKLFHSTPSPCIPALMSTARSHGHSSEGLIWSEVRDDGSVLDSSFRLWPHTEVIKAELSVGGADRCETAALCVERLYETFLKPAYRGGWHDRFSSDGQLLVNYMPASSLYHIVCAFSELESHCPLTLQP